MKKYYLAVLYLLCTTILFGQQKPTKSQLIKLFKASIEQESGKSVSVGGRKWTICNNDSAFFKADTIKIYSNANYFYQLSKCCNFINWTFYKKDRFIQSTSQICNEPSTRNVKVEYNKITFLVDREILHLAIINNHSLNVFDVVKIEEVKLANNNSTKVITLVKYQKGPIVGHTY